MRFLSSSSTPGLVEAEAVGEGASADGHEHLVRGNSRALPSRSAVSTPLAKPVTLAPTSIFRPCFCRRRVKDCGQCRRRRWR
jgi:hypothetical protein